MPTTPSLIWPLPALFAWGACWAVFGGLSRAAPIWLALLLGCLVGVLASLWGRTWWRRAMIALGFPVSLAAAGVATLPAWAWLLPLGLLLLVYPLNAWRDAPVFPTPQGALDDLPAHVPLHAGAQVLDAGCGMGDGLQALHRAYPQAAVHGLEWSWVLRWVSALRCPWARVRRGDMWAADWSGYDLLYIFQRPESMLRAALKAQGEMAPGSWLVSLDFAVPDATAHATWPAQNHTVYVYALPLWPEARAAAEAALHAPVASPQEEDWHAIYPRRKLPKATYRPTYAELHPRKKKR